MIGPPKMNHLLQSIEQSLNTGNHYAALAMALAIPDICGWIEDPNATSKARYISWFERYLQNKYIRQATALMPEHTFLTGSDCYALRCAFLHEGRENITEQRAQQVLESFKFIVPPSGWTVHMNQENNSLQLQVDIFCRDVIEGVTHFLSDISTNDEASSRRTQGLLIRDINGQPI
jgi:hypothetical protein